MKKKLTVTHLWMFACVAYGFAVFMVFEGRLVGSILSAVLCLLLLTCTRWAVNHGEVEVRRSE
ncbi:MAG: hypothetical protein NWE91_08865 [Candidatus Bathyarchaeota archaeon]|nr:hypothetical protein [Candidatus Bathyarchaeota archaeon]